jgi:hypothetical protein
MTKTEKIDALVDDLQAFCARHNLHYALCSDPDTGKMGVLIAQAKSVKYMPYMEMTGVIDVVPPKSLM